jgi:glucose/mannose transport system substrate-binding protein
VAELAKAFDASGDKWVDGAIAGGGGTARPIMISRITGGDPMGATQFNHGQQALELVEAGLMLDLTDVAEANNWKDRLPAVAAGCLHRRRQDLLRAGEHPLAGMAVAVEQGL